MKVYLTFGQVHEHVLSGTVFNKDTVAVFDVEDEATAREIAFKLFGPKWFTTYTDGTWKRDSIAWLTCSYINVSDVATWKMSDVTRQTITELLNDMDGDFYAFAEEHDSCGICYSCGELYHEVVEPDAELCKCPHCDKMSVHGMMKAMMEYNR